VLFLSLSIVIKNPSSRIHDGTTYKNVVLGIHDGKTCIKVLRTYDKVIHTQEYLWWRTIV
jgi:hypothetical protein